MESATVKSRWTTGCALLSGIALAEMALQLTTSRQYGIFRDELYYLACARHLAWGYVDQPPLIAAVARVVTTVLGTSLPAIRLLPGVAAGALVLVTGLMARRLGGGRFAQVLAAVSIGTAPGYLFLGHVLTMNAFEPLFWMGCAYLVIVVLETRSSKLWLWLGMIAGVGFMNKHSMFFFAVAVVVGLLLTPERTQFRARWIWLGGALMLLIALPHLVWQAQHGWPQLEILRNVQRGKNYRMSAWEFLGAQIIAMGPQTLPIWVAGLCFFLISAAGKSYRPLGWAYVVLFVSFVILHGKFYYMLPVYPMLLASGAVLIERVIEEHAWKGLRTAAVTVVVAIGAATAPLALPLLPVESYIRYTRLFGVDEVKMEVHQRGRLPLVYADMFGWENLAASVARVYNSLPSEERRKTAIFASNYGEAGAIDYYGSRYGLPNAISGHNNYYLWGPRDYTGEVVIAIGGRREEYQQVFDRVEQAAVISNDYAMPYENDLPVWLCRQPRVSLLEAWPRAKHYD